jgi:hypothetical protein
MVVSISEVSVTISRMMDCGILCELGSNTYLINSGMKEEGREGGSSYVTYEDDPSLHIRFLTATLSEDGSTSCQPASQSSRKPLFALSEEEYNTYCSC